MDSNDQTRMAEAREELFAVLEDDAMRDVPFVIIANKQDLPNAMKPTQMIEALQLRKLGLTHKWHVQGTCALHGDGIYEAMETMAKLVREQHR